MDKTWDLQSSLPRLPVPQLEATVPKYLKSIEPYCATQEAYDKHRDLVLDFAKTVAPSLQAALLERYTTSVPPSQFSDKQEVYSWLERWWSDYAYFLYRDSVLINVTYGMTYEDLPSPVTKLQRAAQLASILLGLKRELELYVRANL